MSRQSSIHGFSSSIQWRGETGLRNSACLENQVRGTTPSSTIGKTLNHPVIDEYNSLLCKLVANFGLFNAEDQAFIEREKLAERLRQFRVINLKYDTFLQGRENPDDDMTVVGNSFNSLLSELLSNLDLFNPEDRDFIESAKKRTYIPQIRLRLSRAKERANSRSRSVSRSTPPSSTDSSFASTSESSTV